MTAHDPADPKGLIAESFEIEGVGLAECRTIFLDWAMSLPEELKPAQAARRMISRHQGKPRDHPMQEVLREALREGGRPVRRGGWKARRAT